MAGLVLAIRSAGKGFVSNGVHLSIARNYHRTWTDESRSGIYAQCDGRREVAFNPPGENKGKGGRELMVGSNCNL